MSIAENLALATRRGKARGLGWALPRRFRSQLGERVRGLGMGLEDRLDNAIGSLSGGQRQALTLLMATWVKPQLLLLDEHTAALDPKSADQVIRLSQEIIARDQLTTLMVTHSMHQATALGDRLIMMHEGRVLHDFLRCGEAAHAPGGSDGAFRRGAAHRAARRVGGRDAAPGLRMSPRNGAFEQDLGYRHDGRAEDVPRVPS